MPDMQGFEGEIAFDAAEDFAAFLTRAPARWTVYLLSDGEGRPFQLLSVKNLRASLANRLCEHPADARTRSIPYREVVRKVSWRRVDSQAEADWVYAQAARELFPAAHGKLIESWSAWYVTVDTEARFPHYVLTDHPQWELSRTTFGPMPTKLVAQKFAETVQDAFDLCRCYHILVQAPLGQACSYKQMGKCLAPCDGSSSMEMYHQQIEHSIAAIGSRQVIESEEKRMRQAASALQFELAGKIKARLQQLRSLGTGRMEHVRPLAQMRFVAVLRGGKARHSKLMLLTSEQVELTGEFTDIEQMVPVLADMQSRCEQLKRWDEMENLTFIARQLMLKSADGIFTTGARAEVEAAMAQLARRKIEQSPDEGVVQEAR